MHSSSVIATKSRITNFVLYHVIFALRSESSIADVATSFVTAFRSSVLLCNAIVLLNRQSSDSSSFSSHFCRESHFFVSFIRMRYIKQIYGFPQDMRTQME